MLRHLLLLLCLGGALGGCSLPNGTTESIPCTHGSGDKECPGGFVCGEDDHCRAKPICDVNNKHDEQICPNGVCTSLQTPLDCGKCGNRCTDGFKCDVHLGTADAVCVKSCDAAQGQKECSGTCRDVSTDRNNCGDCGHSCDSGFSCVAGACSLVCPGTLAACGTTCVEKSRDPANCGDCGHSCASGEACVSGTCTLRCPGTQRVCSNTCVDAQTDESNCGACGNACGSGQSCVAGQCQLSCQTGLASCAVNGTNVCVDEQTDRRNCGTCGHACNAGEICSTGLCVANCPAGEAFCSGSCVNVQSDPGHCGNCTTACQGGETCQGGHCLLSCQTGLASCDVAGVPTCVDKKTDARNCGACGAPCGTGQVCSNGSCQVSCQASELQCGSSCVNGATDPNNCGTTALAACGHSCLQGERCLSGVCTPSCLTGSQPCGAPATCVNTQTDNKNCNACGHACPDGTACTSGSCVPTCSGNAKLCGSLCRDVTSDPNNCGDCGTAGPANLCAAGQVCNNRVCQTSCPSGQVQCGNSCVSIDSDPNNCGSTQANACGHKCQAGELCISGSCSVSCQNGLATCGGICTNLSFDPNNCGACASSGPSAICGPYSHATAACSNGNCVEACASGFADCAQATPGVPDGCETNISIDANNCGACGNVCPAPDNSVGSCSGAHCGGSSCKPGYNSCDGTAANGCESNKLTDANNCGSCANVCSGATPYCNAGTCSSVLPAGVLQDVPVAGTGPSSTVGSFTLCYSDAYGTSGPLLSLVGPGTPCNGAKLLVGCRPSGSPRLSLAAFAPVADATFEMGTGNTTHTFNGVAWYFNGASSWGFAPAGATVDRSGGCDVKGSAADGFAGGFGSERMCWRTVANALGAGLRCGDQDSLSAGGTYERVIFTGP